MFFLCAHSGLQNCELFFFKCLTDDVCHMFLTDWKTGMSESESDSKSKSESGTPKRFERRNLCWFVGVAFFSVQLTKTQGNVVGRAGAAAGQLMQSRKS